MERNTKLSKIIYALFLVFIAFTFIFFVVVSNAMNSDFSFDDSSIYDWSDSWEVNASNYSDDAVSLPLNIDNEANSAVLLKKQLPDRIKKYNCILLESKRQDIMVNVNGVLRTSYSDKDVRRVGNSSPAAYVMVPLYNTDSNADISIIITSNTRYSGEIGKIYLGNEMSIVLSLIKNNMVWMSIAIFILICGIISIVSYCMYAKSYDDSNQLLAVFWISFLSAIWCLTQSNIRQVFVGNLALFENLGYCCLMLLPLAIMLYVKSIFKEKYFSVYAFFSLLLLANFVLENVLQVITVLDFFEMQDITQCMLLVVVGVAIVICIIELYKKFQKDLSYLMGSLFCLAIGMIAEAINNVVSVNRCVGNYFSIGMAAFLVTAITYIFSCISEEQKRKKDAESANIAKSKFLATMSHEIRTPINAVLGMNEMILRDSKEPAISEYANNISEAGKTLLSLVNDILDFSKIESGKMEIINVEYQPKSLLRDLILMTRGRIDEKGLTLVLDIDESIPARCFGDEIRIKQVITNILTNAVKYTPEGSITFTVKNMGISSNEVELYFSVKDTGIGIRKEDLEKLSDSFVRVDELRNRKIEGTGLGLSITKQLLMLMDSSLELSSVYGEGSDFHFILKQKVMDESPMGEITLQQDIVKRKGPGYIAPEARVLAVDDNSMNLTVVKGLLRPTKIQVDTCSSGAECLSLCEKQYYDVILMDHMMPEMDGIETLKNLRENYNSPCCSTKVIALTANAVSGAAKLYMDSGFDGYLTKPIDINELNKCLTSILPKELILPADSIAATGVEAENENRFERGTLAVDGTGLDITALDTAAENGEVPLTTSLIDGAVAMTYSGDDYENYLEILKAYYKQGVKNQDAAGDNTNSLFGEVSIENFTIMVHALKSSSKTVGAMSLSEIAEKLEAAGKEQDMDFILAHEAECKGLYDSVLAEIEVYLVEKGMIKPKKAESAADTTSAVAAGDSSAGALSEDVREKLEQIKDALDEFDYDVAMEIVEGILNTV